MVVVVVGCGVVTIIGEGFGVLVFGKPSLYPTVFEVGKSGGPLEV